MLTPTTALGETAQTSEPVGSDVAVVYVGYDLSAVEDAGKLGDFADAYQRELPVTNETMAGDATARVAVVAATAGAAVAGTALTMVRTRAGKALARA